MEVGIIYMIEVIKDIASVIGCIMAAIGLLATIFKPIRKGIGNWIKGLAHTTEQQTQLNNMEIKLDGFIETIGELGKRLNRDMNTQREFAKNQCRVTIKDIFYRYCESKIIPIYEFQIASSTYCIYHDEFEGNSFITLLFDEMKTWDIDYTHGCPVVES